MLAWAGLLGPDPLDATQAPDSLDGAPYQEIGTPRVRVRYAPGDSLVAIRVLDLLVRQQPLPGILDSLPAGVTAVLAHTPAAFDALTGGMVPEWGAGVAIPSAAVLVVPTGEGPRILDPEGRRVLRHEWAHLGLHQHVEGMSVPRWFDEGYAQLASGGWEASQAWKLRLLLATGRAPPFDSLTLQWPRDRAAAEVAYLLSASALTYVLGDSGERGLGIFLNRWKESRSFDLALQATFGVTTSQMEEDWRRHVRTRYGWLFVASRLAASWILLVLVLLVMRRLRRARSREGMARLRASEMPEQPVFWREDPPRGPGDPDSGVRDGR
jgi:hypothetical protein